MIDIGRPAIALNDTRVATSYFMTETIAVEEWASRKEVIDAVLNFARKPNADALLPIYGVPLAKSRIQVVISCHGSPGYLQLGEGFRAQHTDLFVQWKGLVEKIWIVACSPARIRNAGSVTDGNAFCSKIAKAASCYVVAGTQTQWSRERNYPSYKIDSFEGLVLSYGPQGEVTWNHRYPSRWRWNRE